VRKLVVLLLACAILWGPQALVRRLDTRVALMPPLAGRVIAVDPGHGGVDPGALGPGGVHEKDIVLTVGLKVRTLLESSGAIVVMTRETDTDLSDAGLGHQYSARKRQDLSRRVALVNGSGAALLVSIHLNSMAASRWHGAQVFFSAESTEGRRLAVIIQESLRETLQNTRRLAATGEYYIIQKSKCPAVIVEAGFISNPAEAALLFCEQYQARVALAIYRGILRFLG